MQEIQEAFRGGAESARDHFNAQMERICVRLENIESALDNLDTTEELVRTVISPATADGGGLASLYLKGPRAGQQFVLQRVIVGASVAPGGKIYVGAKNFGGLVALINGFVTEIQDGVPVYPGQDVLIEATGIPAGEQIAGSLVYKKLHLTEHDGH